MKTLGERLKRVREERGLTQEALGVLVHVSDATINRYEKNLRKPTPEMLRELAGALGTSGNYLLGLTDDPNPIQVREPVLGWTVGGKPVPPEDRPELLRYLEWLEHRRATEEKRS